MFTNYIRAVIKKIKGLKIFQLHLLIPACTALAFLLYYQIAPGSAYLKIEAYFQVLGSAFPFLTSLFCTMCAEQELAAGSFQNMLAAPSRIMAFYSTLFVLVISGIMAVLLASVLFGAGYFVLTGESVVNFSFYFIAAFVIAGSNIFLYTLHMFLAMRFNKGVVTGAGIVGSLVAALLVTGLGDGIWIYIPAAWAPRFTSLVLQEFAGNGIMELNYISCGIAVMACIIVTFAGLVAFGIWALYWDGLRGSE